MRYGQENCLFLSHEPCLLVAFSLEVLDLLKTALEAAKRIAVYGLCYFRPQRNSRVTTEWPLLPNRAEGRGKSLRTGGIHIIQYTFGMSEKSIMDFSTSKRV